MASNSISYAYKLLSMRDYFKQELFEKIEKKYGIVEAEKVIAEMENMGYINDENTAYNYIRNKLKSGYGPYYISNKLYSAGCRKEISFIESVASREEIDITEIIKQYSKRYIKKNSENPYKDYIKCITFLKNKGFSQSLIMTIIKKEDFE